MLWDNAASDPLAQIDLWIELYAKLTGLVATDLVMGSTAYRAFIANAKVKAAMVNTSLIQTGVIAAGVPNGARWSARCTAARSAVDLPRVVRRSGQRRHDHRDGAGQEGHDRLRQAAHRDALRGEPGSERRQRQRRADASSKTRAAFCRAWVEKDPPARILEMRSRPLPVPIQNHFLTVQVLT
jgi:hypothetical protein